MLAYDETHHLPVTFVIAIIASSSWFRVTLARTQSFAFIVFETYVFTASASASLAESDT